MISWGLKNKFKLPNEWGDSPNIVRCLLGIAGAAGMAGSIIGFTCNLRDFVMVWFAPKIWLITEIANLVHKQ
jgi:hypothetical protein